MYRIIYLLRLVVDPMGVDRAGDDQNHLNDEPKNFFAQPAAYEDLTNFIDIDIVYFIIEFIINIVETSLSYKMVHY